MFWKSLWAAVAVGVITLCWPLIRQAWDVGSVNFIVYTDRKRFEAQRCWELQSLEGLLGIICMFVVDMLQIWLSASILLSWVMTSEYFFPIPSIPIRPAALMGGPISEGPLSRYGINVAPMVIGWAFRFVSSKLEGWVGRAFQRAHKRQRKQQRTQETPAERAARKEAKRVRKEEKRRQREQERQNDPRFNQPEPDIRPLSVEEMQEAAVKAAESRQKNLESNTEFDDLD